MSVGNFEFEFVTSCNLIGSAKMLVVPSPHSLHPWKPVLRRVKVRFSSLTA